MKKRLVIVMGVMSALALSLAGLVSAQTEEDGGMTDAGQDGERAVVALDEVGGSGYQGIAVMNGNEDETDIVAMVMQSASATAQAGQPSSVAIMSGTCEDPEETVEDLGSLQSVQLPGHENETYALNASVSMALDELLQGDYVIAVLADDGAGVTPSPGELDASPTPEVGETPTPAVPEATPSPTSDAQQADGDALACGELTSDAVMDGIVPVPGVPTTPDEATPTPSTPTPGI